MAPIPYSYSPDNTMFKFNQQQQQQEDYPPVGGSNGNNESNVRRLEQQEQVASVTSFAHHGPSSNGAIVQPYSQQHVNQHQQQHYPQDAHQQQRQMLLPVDQVCQSWDNNITDGQHPSLKKWIAAALLLGDDTESSSNNKTISSGPYLTCALKIALSLADQLCELDEQEVKEREKEIEGGESKNVETSHSQVVPQGLLWPDLVTVYLNKIVEGDENNRKSDDIQEENVTGGIMDEKKDDGFVFGSFHPIDESQRTGDEDGEQPSTKGNDSVFNLLPEIFSGVQDGEQDYQDDYEPLPVGAETHHHRGGGDQYIRTPDVDYLDISSAKLHLENKDNTHPSSPPSRHEDKRMHIYYLGLVLFELFSGGKNPLAEDEQLGTDPLAGHLNAHSDLANAMSIIDALGDDDELFGGGSSLDESALSEQSLGCSDNSRKSSFRSAPHHSEVSKKKTVRAPASSTTVEPLKSLGLPIALCDLIGNMIDSSKGDFSKDETYSCMADVKKDLSLMMDSPGIYLHDIDLDLASKTGLQMDDRTATWYGRDAELASLKENYTRSISGTCEAFIICGHNSTGKSQLAHEFFQYAKVGDAETGRKGCILLSGKFEQSQPFSPIASAFNKYCEWLVTSSDKNNASIAENVSRALKQTLGKEANALAKVIPSLSKIIGDNAELDESDGFEDAQKRLHYLFSQFTEVIFRCHDAPLVLYIDNLQWADPASIAFIKQLLLVSESSRANDKQFFFLGCFTHNELDKKEHLIWPMLDSASHSGVKTTKMELACLDSETVNSMISKKLHMLPRLTRPLTDIVMFKTSGHHFFIRQLMIELSKEGLLRPSLSQCRWSWDEEQIQERELPDDVVKFMTASLIRLPSKVLSALCTLSCFGSCSDRSLLALENELGLSFLVPLDHAVAEGFLNKNKEGGYQFVDDRVQEAAYNLMKPEERCLHHFSYGLTLCSVATRNNDDGLFLMAVGQLNLGGPKAAADNDERMIVAKHNLKAGKKAMAMSDLSTAYWFCDYGISYLQKNHWQDHYSLSLELFNGAAECALSIGEYETLAILSEQVLRFAKCVEDKIPIFHVTVRTLIRRSNLPAAIQCGIDALSNLGEDFPVEVTPDTVIHFLEDTKEMLDGMSDEELISHKLMTDSNKINAMKFLAILSEPLYMIRPSDQPIVVLQMVILSIEHGMSPLSPLAFVVYGSFLASMGDIREGCRYARISKALLDKVGSRQVTGNVMAYFAQLMAYSSPVQSAIEFHIEGGKAAMTSGSTVYGLMNAMLYDICSYWSGKKLRSVVSRLGQTVSLLKQNKGFVFLVQLMPLYDSVSQMIGVTNRRPSNTQIDAGFDSMYDTSKIQRDLRENNPFQSKPHYFNKMYTAFMFRNYDGMTAAQEQYSKYKMSTWIFVFSSSIQTFYEGLISYWIGRKENDNSWIEKGKNARREIEQLADSASKWNFDNKYKLLQAEEQFCAGNLELAETLYDSSILSAKEHRFVNEEALANELAGEFYLETSRIDLALICFSHALEKYNEWEAYGKVKFLERKMRQIECNANDDQMLVASSASYIDSVEQADVSEELKHEIGTISNNPFSIYK